MKSSIRNEAEGIFHEIKGKAKEIAGKLSDNPKLKAEGIAEKNAGKVQRKIRQIKDLFEEDWRWRTSEQQERLPVRMTRCAWRGGQEGASSDHTIEELRE